MSSLAWNPDGKQLAMGDTDGNMHLYDAGSDKMIRASKLHTSRISILKWNGHLLTSGGKDNMIIYYDVRTKDSHMPLRRHGSEVCGLAWSADGVTLASGGNDNRAVIWDMRSTQ